MEPSEFLVPIAVLALGAPLAATLLLGALLLRRESPSEKVVSRLAQGAFWIAFAASATGAALFFGTSSPPSTVSLGEWFRAGEQAFHLGFVSDRLTWAMLLLTSGLSAVVTHFSAAYLHRDPGFRRFHFLVALFCFGMLVVASASSLEQLLLGWELVGLSSALLVGFFQERNAPTRASVRVFSTYRLCDLGILTAAALLHHALGHADFELGGVWGDVHQLPVVGGLTGVLVAGGLILGALGKSAQLPFGNWLPRAMEGPTPSSALFYGGISVHAGVLLLLRAAPVLDAIPGAALAVGAIGGATAFYAALALRTQADAKGTLAFATLVQVGVMFVEIACGLYGIALLHLVSHALLRLYQLLRAPSALRDAELTDAALEQTTRVSSPTKREVSPFWYRLAFERAFLETAQERWLLGPLLRLSRFLEAREARWLQRFDPTRSPEPEPPPSALAVPPPPRSEP